jgi:type VI secretion system secreted protein Hcp
MAGSIFARIGTIQGESQDVRHRDEIEVLSWSWGLSQSGEVAPGGGGGEGKASLQDFTFVHYFDKASPVLMTACATGAHIENATITVRKAGKDEQEYLVIVMTDVLVRGVSTSGSEGDTAVESVTLAFAGVDLEYTPQLSDGSLDAGVHFRYDLEREQGGLAFTEP